MVSFPPAGVHQNGVNVKKLRCGESSPEDLSISVRAESSCSKNESGPKESGLEADFIRAPSSIFSVRGYENKKSDGG